MTKIVVGVDSSTQSTKAIAWNVKGESIAEGRYDIPISNPSMFFFEQNPEDWWSAFCKSSQELNQQIETSNIEAIAISNQRETIGYFYKRANPFFLLRCGWTKGLGKKLQNFAI